jgi:hypothetical protein
MFTYRTVCCLRCCGNLPRAGEANRILTALGIARLGTILNLCLFRKYSSLRFNYFSRYPCFTFVREVHRCPSVYWFIQTLRTCSSLHTKISEVCTGANQASANPPNPDTFCNLPLYRIVMLRVPTLTLRPLFQSLPTVRRGKDSEPLRPFTTLFVISSSWLWCATSSASHASSQTSRAVSQLQARRMTLDLYFNTRFLHHAS